MIKLKTILNEIDKEDMVDPRLKPYLLKNHTQLFSGELYHGTPLDGLKEMLTRGIYGTQHGEVAEEETLSTSVNPDVLQLFSDMNGYTGLIFDVKNFCLLVLDDVLSYFATRLPGSGLTIEVDEKELRKFLLKFKLPLDRFEHEPHFPYNYIASLGVDGFVYEYTWDRIKGGYSGGDRDESEIAIVGNSIQKLNESIVTIYVEGTEYEISQKAEVLADIEARL